MWAQWALTKAKTCSVVISNRNEKRPWACLEINLENRCLSGTKGGKDRRMSSAIKDLKKRAF